MDAHESCQAGNRAALRGIIHVPQGRRLCGFMGRTIYFRKNSKGIFTKRFAARRAHNFCAKRKKLARSRGEAFLPGKRQLFLQIEESSRNAGASPVWDGNGMLFRLRVMDVQQLMRPFRRELFIQGV